MSPLTIFFCFILFLAFALLSLNFLLAPHNPYQEKVSVFECGFSSFLHQNRQEFSISFFVFALCFLIFDLEIVLIYPYVVSAYNNSIYGLVIVLIFLVILTAGFVYELGRGALKINSRQSNNLNNISITPVASPIASPKGFNKKLNLTQRRSYSTNSYKPEKVYTNADIDKVVIYSENKNKSGIYLWKNTINKKKYIGSAKNLRKRFYDYYSLKYLIHGTSYIKRAILNYGYANFSLEILEYCEISELRTKDKYYFDLLSPEYNIAKDPTSPMLGRKHSEDTLTKMSASVPPSPT